MRTALSARLLVTQRNLLLLVSLVAWLAACSSTPPDDTVVAGSGGGNTAGAGGTAGTIGTGSPPTQTPAAIEPLPVTTFAFYRQGSLPDGKPVYHLWVRDVVTGDERLVSRLDDQADQLADHRR